MAPHSSTFAWKIPWTEEPGRLQSMRSLRVGQDWVTSLSLFTFMHWRRKWQPTPVFLPGESQGRGSLVGCRLCRRRVGHNWSDFTVILFLLEGQRFIWEYLCQARPPCLPLPPHLIYLPQPGSPPPGHLRGPARADPCLSTASLKQQSDCVHPCSVNTYSFYSVWIFIPSYPPFHSIHPLLVSQFKAPGDLRWPHEVANSLKPSFPEEWKPASLSFKPEIPDACRLRTLQSGWFSLPMNPLIPT